MSIRLKSMLCCECWWLWWWVWWSVDPEKQKIQGASVNRAILQHWFYWFGNIGAHAAIAILLPTLKRLSCNAAVDYPVAWRESQGRQGTAGQSRPSPAMTKSTKRIAFSADQLSALRLPWLRFSVIFLSCQANARAFYAKSGRGGFT